MTKVSIIIPVYNNEKYVEKCIQSIMQQTYRALDIIVVDDGSTDRSGEILDLLSYKDDRIRIFHQKNIGVAAARNKGIDEATGEYITFVDGDDYIGNDYIEKLVKRAEEKHADMVICGLKYISEQGNLLREIIPGKYIKGEKEEWAFRISAVCSHLYLRSLWEKYHIRFVTGERGEDMPIALFFSAVCDKIVTLQEAEYYYVQHTESAMHNFRGLKNYRLPYSALECILVKLQNIGIKCSHDFYCLFVLRILSTYYFDLASGAKKEKKKELCEYIVRILNKYLPGYYRNYLLNPFISMEVPYYQRIAVVLLVILAKTKMLYPFSFLLRKN